MGGSQETEAREESAASTEEKNDGVIPLERTLDERCAISLFNHLRILAYELALSVSSTDSEMEAIAISFVGANTQAALAKCLVNFWFVCGPQVHQYWDEAQQRSWLNRLYMLILGSEEGVVSLHSGFVILRDCIFTLHWATGRRATGWTAEQDESWLCRLADLATPMATRSKSLCRIMSHERLFPAISLSENTPSYALSGGKTPYRNGYLPGPMGSWRLTGPQKVAAGVAITVPGGIALGALGLAGHYLVNGSQDQSAELRGKCDKLSRIQVARKMHPIVINNHTKSTLKLYLYQSSDLVCVIPIGGGGANSEGKREVPPGQQAVFRPSIAGDSFWLKVYSQLGWIEYPEYSGMVSRGDHFSAARSKTGALELYGEAEAVH
ncbi:hypothetical protein Pmar_PMAR004735 [Perkinsus marinus ATCC 50983]|uniref:Uncharacterized protein n=1 Tax=Perkinsus marinus (strain ATCC 50983 / TXsc) TaxID=423536 RepID=C5KF81_PERM5|nr:hypothetical protein Pmar_PMAR004735 [Perkinsus marinus ATCC 50983]EER16883.1 hypothetical protein Pmar_PMAR004735 [Perkinsus marinus ATCC 50983]|eukprot:XP_002785087.1 hypothetical protein Pmar_PMAR004735 [Perkinsus marinus ATCC 50983]